MPTNRPFVVSIAGFDPCAGAGVLADIKTFEQHKVYGFAINTANTIQTENEFVALQWTALDFVLQSIQTLFTTYEIKAAKIGIVPSLEYLKEIIFSIKKYSPQTKIVWDTVLKSTTNFDFLKVENQMDLIAILDQIDLITPNYDEILKLDSIEKNPINIAKKLSFHCAVLLKGGHHPTKKGLDTIFLNGIFNELTPAKSFNAQKHGTGCVLSASITANLALEEDLTISCVISKKYIESFLMSNPTKLGNHYV